MTGTLPAESFLPHLMVRFAARHTLSLALLCFIAVLLSLSTPTPCPHPFPLQFPRNQLTGTLPDAWATSNVRQCMRQLEHLCGALRAQQLGLQLSTQVHATKL